MSLWHHSRWRLRLYRWPASASLQLFLKLKHAVDETSHFSFYNKQPNPVWSLGHIIESYTVFSAPRPPPPGLPSLYPDGVGAIWPARVGGRGRGVAGRGEVAERGEELLHLFLQHLVSPLGVVLGALGVAQLDLGHGVLLPLLVQLLVEVHHLRLQLQVALLQAAEEVEVQDQEKCNWE